MSCTLIQGDCIVEMQKLIDDGIKVDLVLTDPPYNISKLNDNRDRSNMDSPIMRRKKPLNYDFGAWDNMERQEFLDFTQQWYELCVDLLRERGGHYDFIFQ